MLNGRNVRCDPQRLMQTRFLLIDYENVQPKCLEGLDPASWRVVVFVGAKQTRVPFEFAAALQALGTAAEYRQVCGSGRNALDFHIAFEMGRLAESNPKACFCVISKDTGFDPLITQMRNDGIAAQRYPDLSDALNLSPPMADADAVADRVSSIVRNLRSRGNARPRRRATLISTIQSLHQKSLTGDEVEGIIDRLLQKGYVSLDGEAVTYRLPGD